jgi:hypothetical protein
MAFARKHKLQIITTAQMVEFRKEAQGGCAPAKAVATPVDVAAYVRTAADKRFMLEALAEASKGRLSAPPNPWVGCVVVKNSVVIGRGFHNRAGEPHAEVMALQDASDGV